MPERAIALRQTLHLKVKGTDTALPIGFGDLAAMRAEFAAAHRARFGFDPGDAALVIHAVEVEAVGEAADLSETEVATTRARRGRAGDRAGRAGLRRRRLARRALRAARRRCGPATR